MIKLTDFNGKTVYVAGDAIASITEAGTSSQWHGIRSIVKLRDSTTIECNETADKVNDLVREFALDTRVEKLKSEVVRLLELLGKRQDEHNALQDKAEKLEAQLEAAQPEPIGHIDYVGKLADFMSTELRQEHEARGSETPEHYKIPVYLASRRITP